MAKRFLFFLSLLLFLTSCLEGEGEPYQWYANNQLSHNDFERGYNHFLYYDFGALNADAIVKGGVFPWRLSMAAIRFRKGKASEGQLKSILQQQGLLFPKRIANGPQGMQRFDSVDDTTPLGIVRGAVDLKVTVGVPFKLGIMDSAHLGCASCHSSHGYDAHGNPQLGEVWLGESSGSFNPEGFVNEIYLGLKYANENRRAFAQYVRELHPNDNDTTQQFIRRIFRPIRTTLKELESLQRITAQHNGGPGRTNGVAALANYVEAYNNVESFHRESRGYTSIPVVFDRQFRSSFLVDGLYGIKGKRHFVTSEKGAPALSAREVGQIVSFFTVPSSGNTPDRPAKVFKEAKETVNFITQLQKEPFPGEIDWNSADRGRKLYVQNCQQCHGTYSRDLQNPELVSYPNRLVPWADIRTDSVRLDVINRPLLNKMLATEFDDHLSVKPTGGYVATLLTQVWKSAPYLHNGSVPNLSALMGLEERPRKFMVGGHKLDYHKVGIAGSMRSGVYRYPRGYKPWSRPEVYDTSHHGQGNWGHEREFSGLSRHEKLDLMEYLKLL